MCICPVAAPYTVTRIHLKYNWLMRGIVGYAFLFRVYLCMEDREKQFQMCVGPQLRFCEYVAVNCIYKTHPVNYFNSLWHFDHRYSYSNDEIRIIYQQADIYVTDIYLNKDIPNNLNVSTILLSLEKWQCAIP